MPGQGSRQMNGRRVARARGVKTNRIIARNRQESYVGIEREGRDWLARVAADREVRFPNDLSSRIGNLSIASASDQRTSHQRAIHKAEWIFHK